jgi:hypothetical protein
VLGDDIPHVGRLHRTGADQRFRQSLSLYMPIFSIYGEIGNSGG